MHTVQSAPSKALPQSSALLTATIGTRPLSRAPQKIVQADIVVIAKDSKVQFDQRRFALNVSGLKQKYLAEGADPERIFASHERQQQALEQLQTGLGEAVFVHRSVGEGDLRAAIGRAKLVVALGGDNHFQFVANLLEDRQCILGVNSDPRTSFGALLGSRTAELLAQLNKLAKRQYLLEPWTRLKITLNGQAIGRAFCDAFLGQRERPYMSRYVLELDGRQVEQKSSGLLVATGAGSSGWYKSAGRFIFPHGNVFPPTTRCARFLNTEVSASVAGQFYEHAAGQLPPLSAGVVPEGSRLTVHSLNDREGILILDSLRVFPFTRGAKAHIEVDQEPLWVLKWQQPQH